jgi:hypothetical protein
MAGECPDPYRQGLAGGVMIDSKGGTPVAIVSGGERFEMVRDTSSGNKMVTPIKENFLLKHGRPVDFPLTNR